jgi:hypothetical protein
MTVQASGERLQNDRPRAGTQSTTRSNQIVAFQSHKQGLRMHATPTHAATLTNRTESGGSQGGNRRGGGPDGRARQAGCTRQGCEEDKGEGGSASGRSTAASPVHGEVQGGTGTVSPGLREQRAGVRA